MSNRKVTFVKLKALTVPFLGILNVNDRELPPRGSHDRIDMIETEYGIEVTVPNVYETQIVPFENIEFYRAIDADKPIPTTAAPLPAVKAKVVFGAQIVPKVNPDIPTDPGVKIQKLNA